MLNVKWNTGSQETAANADILMSEAANSVKVIAYLAEIMQLGNILIERKSDAGRKYYSLSADNADKLVKALTTK